jgi:hypothetical protein
LQRSLQSFYHTQIYFDLCDAVDGQIRDNQVIVSIFGLDLVVPESCIDMRPTTELRYAFCNSVSAKLANQCAEPLCELQYAIQNLSSIYHL